jgi:3-(3-hydroxy-phenyl)propionate hydroxylase
LEILDRLGCGERAAAKGVVWNVGNVFLRDKLLYQFNLLPEAGHKHPAFINLQQYHLEQLLIERLLEIGNVDARWRNRVVGVTPQRDGVQVEIETPDGNYNARCDYLIVADGARSPVRKILGLEAQGQVFRDRFLIADITLEADFPSERRFWFDPPFHPGQSALLHRQADSMWRIDLQLGWDVDPEEERKHERIVPRVEAMLGVSERAFKIEWASVYTFQCRQLDQFRHGRVLFAGDAAHQMSPFGARGANSGIQDADNLVWKLARVIRGKAPPALLDTYDDERVPAAAENILNSTRSTDFITPKSHVSKVFRDATLQLAQNHPFARALVNSGRLSIPHTYRRTPLSTPDRDAFSTAPMPGAPAVDAPVATHDGVAWLCKQLGGRFIGLYFAGASPPDASTCTRLHALRNLAEPVHPLLVCAPGFARAWTAEGVPAVEDREGLAAQRYDAAAGTLYLIRPDQHVAARWRHLDVRAAREAVRRATGSLSPEFAAWQT